MDFQSLSRFPKSPARAAALHKELIAGRRWIQRFEQEWAALDVIFILGNHCARASKYLWKQAPELDCLPELAVPALLNVPDRWKVIPPGGYVREQGVLIIHGNRYAQNTCSKYLDEYACSVVAGHSHRANSMTRRLPSGRVITAIEAGCLCSFRQCYTQLSNWSHALVVIEAGRAELVRR